MGMRILNPINSFGNGDLFVVFKLDENDQ